MACVCSCNLPLALLAEWLGSFKVLYICVAAVTQWQEWNGYWKKSQHRKLFWRVFLPLLGLEPMTFWLQVWRSNHWAIPAPQSRSWLYFSHSGSEKVKRRKLFYWQVHVQLSLDFVWFLHHVISILYYMGMTIHVMLVTFCQKRNTFPALTKPLMFVFYACRFSKIFEIQCGNIWWALHWIMTGHIYLFVTLLVYMLLLIHLCLIFF